MSYLYLVRHTKSEWNEKGLWTGWANPHLSKTGLIEAEKAGEALKTHKIDLAYTATLIRAKETLEAMKKGMGKDFPTHENASVNERNYGEFTGKNKWQIKEQVGEEEFQNIRRGWDHKIGGGETLKDVYERVAPFFEGTVKPELLMGKNVLIAASGNSLRALEKHIENIPIEKISSLEIGMGDVHRYEFDDRGNLKQKEVVYAGEVDTQKK